MDPDIQVEDHGSLMLFRPATRDGRAWLECHTDGEWFGGALAVEPRYAEALADGAIGDGLTVAC
jgi:hypothetical protein